MFEKRKYFIIGLILACVFLLSKVSAVDASEIRGDLNDDGIVNILDFVVFANAFGSYPTHSRWNPNADLDNNEIINIVDLVEIAKNFGKTS